MSDTKFLDLDSLAPKVSFTIRLNGNDHVMKEMTVEDFVWAMKEAQEDQIEEGESAETMQRAINKTIDVLCRQFPTVKREEFAALGMERMTKLLEFTRGMALEGSDETLKRAAEEGNVETEVTE